MKISSNYFYGNRVSDYGIENHRVDYRTLAKAFDCILNNEIMNKTYEIGYWEQESGFVDNEDEIDELNGQLDALSDEIESLTESYMKAVQDIQTAEKAGWEDEVKINKELAETINKQADKLRDEQYGIEDKIYELEHESETEIFQYYIVDWTGAELLKEINEVVFYNEELDMYVWGVTHYGTSWDYVLTDIVIEREQA